MYVKGGGGRDVSWEGEKENGDGRERGVQIEGSGREQAGWAREEGGWDSEEGGRGRMRTCEGVYVTDEGALEDEPACGEGRRSLA